MCFHTCIPHVLCWLFLCIADLSHWHPACGYDCSITSYLEGLGELSHPCPFRSAVAITMDPTTLSIPEMLQLISALSYDISPFSHRVGIPQQERRFKGDPVIRRLLDALVFFLHIRPQRSDHFAMTLSIVQDEIVATVAANTPDDIQVAHSDPSSPHVILNTIWKYMLMCSGTAPTSKENTQLATYLLESYLPLLRFRLSKWRVCYEAFLQSYRKSRSLPETVMNYFDDVDKILSASIVLSDLTEGLSADNISDFMAHTPLCKNLSKHVAKFKANERKLLSLARSLAGRGVGE